MCNRYVKDLINRCEKMVFVTGFITSNGEELVYTAAGAHNRLREFAL